MAWNGDERWTDDMDATVDLEVSDNADGTYVIINVQADNMDGAGIALNGSSLDSLIEQLQILRAGLDS